MHPKFKYIILALVLLALGFIIINPNESNNEVLITIPETEIIKKPKSQSKTAKQQLQLTDVEKRDSHLQNQTNLSVSDDIVSPVITMRTHRLCYRYFSNKSRVNSRYDFLKRFNEKLNDLQKQYFEDYYAFCEQLNKDHPEYHLSDMNKMETLIQQSEQRSLWSQIVSGDIEVDSLDNEQIEDLITQNDLEIMTQAPDVLRHYYEEVIHWGVEDVLQNRQYDYVNYILKTAHQLYLCDIGADCSSQSSVMAMFCFLTAESCGLDFNVFMDTILTSGQQQDILLAYNYLVSKYN